MNVPSNAVIVFAWGKASGIGGTEARMSEAAVELRRRGIKVVSFHLANEPGSPLAIDMRRACDDVVFVDNVFELGRALRSVRASCVVAFGLRSSLALRIVKQLPGRRCRFPLIDARNGLEQGRSRLAWLLDRTTHYSVARFVVNSSAVASSLTTRGLPSSKIVVVESALGDAWTRTTRLDIERDRGLVLMVGNNRPEKNQALGLRAISLCERPVRARVYTDNASELRAIWASLNTANKEIQFIERKRVTPADMACAAVLLHPSSSESLPRVILEARSQGVIPIAFDVGDSRRVIGPKGCIVEEQSAEGLAAALESRLSDAASPDWTAEVPELRTVATYCSELLRVVSNVRMD